MTDTDPVEAGTHEDVLAQAVDTAWRELERQSENGRPGPFVARDQQIVDGDVDMPALVRAITAAYREALEASGWQVVPKEPAHEMLTAAEHPKITSSRLDALRHDYRRMLSAAPKPTE